MSKRLTAAMVDRANSSKPTFDSVVPGLIFWRGNYYLKKVFPGHAGQTRRKLGPATGDGLEATRARAKKWNNWVAAGIDPQDAEAKEREAAQIPAAHTFKAVAESYIADKATWKEHNRRLADDSREIRNLLIAPWGSNEPISTLSPSKVRATLTAIRRRSPHSARAAWNHATQIFRWAVHNEIITASPMASLDKRQLFRGTKLGPRQVILNTDEIAALWRGAGRMPLVGAYYRLLLLTGLRKNELARAKRSELDPKLRALLHDAAANDRRIVWSEVPDDIKVLVVPAERFKSNAVHIAVLSNTACAILETLPRWKGCDYLFSHNGKKPFNEHKGKSRLDARMISGLRALARVRGDDPAQVALQRWVNHDLRRVVKSGLAALKVLDQVSELILGHARRGLAGTYDRYSYLDERRQGLEAWAARLAAITEPQGRGPEAAMGGNVVAYRKRA